MDRNCDIICFALSRWDAPISSPALSLAKEFARKNRVFYIDHPFSWKDFYSSRHTPEIQKRRKALLKGKDIYHHDPLLPGNLTAVTTRLTLPINFLSPGFLYDRFARYNDRILLRTIRRVIHDHSIKEFIYINFFDPYFVRKFPADIKPLRTVYQSMDDISQVTYTNRHGLRLEEEIIQNFDYTLCTSKELTRLKSVFSPNVYFHPNAADLDIFEQAAVQTLPKPQDLLSMNKKIIGYTGSIDYRLDYALLKKIAEEHSDKILFFVGPVNSDECNESGLGQLPNVVFAGPKKITELPSYLQHFDCVIIPFKKNTLTKSIYPLKINEYLGAGKPVITTHFSEDIYSFRDVAYIADTNEEFLALINKAITEDSDALKIARRKIASQNTWEARVEQFWKIITAEPRNKS